MPDYCPQVLDLPVWQKAQARRQTSTPGQVGTSTVNLFSRITFDGYTLAPMRFVSCSPRRDAKGKRNGRWHYLRSDCARMDKAAKATSWRYEWFEGWFLSFVSGLDWDLVAREKAPADDLALETKAAACRAKCENLQRALDRLANLASTSDSPPKTLLEQMTRLEAAKPEAETESSEVEREAEAVRERRNALNDSARKIKKLASSGDEASRLRLREELRRKISRIDVYAEGVPEKMLRDEPVRAPGWPAIRITFVNGAVRWIFCEGKKPTLQASAGLLDTSSAPEEQEPHNQDTPFTKADIHRSKNRGYNGWLNQHHC